jgi:hypothetical protein
MRPLYKLMIGLVVLGGCLLVLGGVFADSHGFEGVLGGIGWFGFLLCALTLILIVLFALGRSLARKTTTA